MKTSRLGVLLTATMVAVVPAAPTAGANQMVYDGKATWVYATGVNLTARAPVTFETTNLSPNSDPVLHLLSPGGTEVAVDDNSAGGKAARLTYTSPTGGTYTLVVRSRTQATAGTCNLLKNGVSIGTVPFGGWHVWLPDLRAMEEIETVQQPGGEGGAHWLYIMKSDGLGLERQVVGGGTASGARYVSNVALGSRWVIVSVPLWKASWEPVRLVRNDVALPGHDPDGDGLGTELEAALGTCSSLTGFAGNFDCSQATDPRDTDGDGIPDGWEVLGRRDMQPHQLLPAWGADPRHKDLFYEVDFMLRMPGETAQKMSPAVARQFARFYQDEVGSVSPLLKAYHAASLRNPDGLTGIRVHLDTGVPPESPADATLYGNWGGYNAVPPVQQPDGSWGGVDFTTAWMTHMAPARRGVFRYMLPTSSGGGSNPVNTYACSAGITEGWVLAHECGHSMGLNHSGPGQPVVDPNCKPNYPSLMNYMFNDGRVSFSDATGAPPLNNWSLKEWGVISKGSPEFIDILEKKFMYWIDRTNGHVDWNRDGVFAPAGTTVRAYANFAPGGGGCEYTRYNHTRVGDAMSTQTPAMARLANRLYVFYSAMGTLKYTFSTSSWNCPVPDVTPCGNFGPSQSVSMDSTGGVDVERIGYGTLAKLLVVTIDGKGNLWERRLSLNPQGQEVWTASSLVPKSSPAAGEPSLARIDGGAYLAYKGTDGRIRFNRMTAEHGWFGEQLAKTPGGAEILTAAFASPAIGRAYLPWKPGLPALYGAFADVSGILDIWWFNNGTERWEKTDTLETRPGPIDGRPAMAWVPYQTNAEYPGRLYLMFVGRNAATPEYRVSFMMMSYVKVTTAGGAIQKTEKVGLYAFFDNAWGYAYGLDLLYEPGVDTNLRAVLTLGDRLKTRSQLWLRPKADGINNFTYTDYNDWETLRIGLCRNLVAGAGTVPNPKIKCP